MYKMIYFYIYKSRGPSFVLLLFNFQMHERRKKSTQIQYISVVCLFIAV